MSIESDQDLIHALDKWVAAHREEIVRDVIDVVNIRSVREDPVGPFPFGEGLGKVIDWGFALGEKYGYETENDGYYTLSFIRRGKTNRELGILGHIDVVHEGDLATWSYEPYNATEKDGYVIGRGSGDNKGPSIAALHVLRALDDLHVELDHTVRIIWGANEESGMEDVLHYLTTHVLLPDYTLVCDGKFPVSIGEKGSISADLVFEIGDDTNLLDFSGGKSHNAIPDYAGLVLKADLAQVTKALEGTPAVISGRDGEVRIAARGIAGHAAKPEGTENAIQKLARIVTDADLIEGKAARDAVKFVAEAFSEYYGVGLGIDSEDEISGKTTHIGGLIRLEGTKLRQSFNARRAIHSDVNKLLGGLQAVAEKNHFVVENLRQSPTRYSDPESPQVRLLVKTARQILGDDLEPPYTSGGGTHAKRFPNAIPFGAKVPRKENKAGSKFGSAHGADEAIFIDDLLEAIKIYVLALIRLDALYAVKE